MNFTNEQMNKAKTAKTAEELLAMAKESGIEMTEDEAKKYFDEMHKEGELSDDELDAVAGGDKGDPQVYDVMGSWNADNCGCNSFSQMYPDEGRTCGNCHHFYRTTRGRSEGKCRREFES